MTRPHISLHPRCGACGDDFRLGQKIVAAIRKSRSVQVINAYTFPDYGASDDTAPDIDWYFCRKPSCSQCNDGAADAATIHVDCYNLFRLHCNNNDSLYRLWLTATWRRPWHGAPSLRLFPDVDASKTMQLAATACSLPQLTAVPAEILHMIGEYAQPSPLGRYRAIIDLAADLNSQEQSWPQSLPLSEIASWERGGHAVVNESLHPIVRITIDCWGLKRIERLVDNPPFAGKRSDTEVYIIEAQERLRDVTVQFQSGLGRLDVPKDSVDLQLWDTPTPPSLESLQNMPRITGTTQFASIDLRKANALTFFVANGSTLAVHGHTRRRSHPETTFDRISRQRQRHAAWIYVPLPSKDRITHFGIRAPHKFTRSPWAAADYSYLFRFELAGDVIVGPRFLGPTQDFIWPVKEQLLLIFNVAELAAISAMSAYPNESSEITPFARLSKAPFQEACFSSAPLEGIVLLQIYSDAETGLCRGILAEYGNGSQRALGECRIGVDPVCTYKSPACLCFTQVTRNRSGTSIELKGIKVSSSYQSEHKHGEVGWSCFPMRGTLQLWFTNEQSILEVIVDEAELMPS
ncbi:hypothetical protein M441DRAFT_56047 [Trichoderma asperellum CBS 433.97]|uniref:Uncharacterized protein n=1 Tax=Trichoderma asperellum (strain ATCC 204424 / CBS 433.97 / NBRC 101777) TaxID=1042311 RepID=A0A2T3ZDX3_TRIA4|nr:hypothetical protein M441DRAFT_56047 [Trichoderma asperellum CBS 433.97]PTB43012.1 hypothetical protein M441DRAFT_56047 [Trichoderma asperellum CBS 433.97]